MSDLAKIRPTKIAAPQTDTSAQPTQPLAGHAPSGAPQGAAPQKTTAGAGWTARGPLMLGWVSLAILVGGFGLWSVLTELSGAVIAPGQVEVEQNRQVVQHPDGGVVAEVVIEEGQEVAAGDVLIRLDGELLRSELTIVEGQFFEILARRGRLEAEQDEATTITFPPELIANAAGRPQIAALIEGQRRLFDARAVTMMQQVDQLRKRRDQISSQIDGFSAQDQSLQQQLKLINQELTGQRDLFQKGLAQASRVLSLEREAARLAGTVGELAASRAGAEQRITETDIEILRLSSARREEALTQLRDLGYRELELAERRRALIEQIVRLDIRAPVSGIVYGLQVTTPRAVIRPAEPVLFLVPQDRPLQIAARVDPLHIDQVHVGQEVTLVFPAFNRRTTPELHGTITQVSADAFTDANAGISFYRAEIVLNPDDREKIADLVLIPGMPVEAFIQTSPRTPMAYLTKPFTDYFNYAFRER